MMSFLNFKVQVKYVYFALEMSMLTTIKQVLYL